MSDYYLNLRARLRERLASMSDEDSSRIMVEIIKKFPSTNSTFHKEAFLRRTEPPPTLADEALVAELEILEERKQALKELYQILNAFHGAVNGRHYATPQSFAHPLA